MNLFVSNYSTQECTRAIRKQSGFKDFKNATLASKTKYFRSLILKWTSPTIWLVFDAKIKMFYLTLAVTSNTRVTQN